MAIEGWPELPYEPFAETRDTLHMRTQVVGKIQLALCPYLNEWWEVALRLTARGLTTGLVPAGGDSFQIDFDFVDHRLRILTAGGEERSVALEPMSVAAFHAAVMSALDTLGIRAEISTLPAEVADPVPFERDNRAAYAAASVERWWRAQLAIERVVQRYRTPFNGKSSPVLFFWGGFDLAHARFNGQPAPIEPGTNRILAYGEDQENIAVGFWPGSREFPHPLLYAYAHPAPAGLAEAPIEPEAARWEPSLGEFVLPYEEALRTGDPDAAVGTFFQSAYEQCARLAGWDRSALEGHVPELA